MTIEIVEARKEHTGEIADLWWNFMYYHENLNPIWAPASGTKHVFIDEHLQPVMDDDNSLVLVTLENGNVSGYSYSKIITPPKISKRDRYGYIHDMFITENVRREGIGDKMLKEIYRWFRSHNISHVELDVACGNQIGESFWRKQGFDDQSISLFFDIE